MKKNSKKKGFTLIELIAVIAILGILAIVIVPNVKGYTHKARNSTVVSDSKVVVNAIDAYNSDAENPIEDNVVVGDITKSNSGYSTLVGSSGTIKKWPASIATSTLTVQNLRDIADGILKEGTGYKVSTSGVVTITK